MTYNKIDRFYIVSNDTTQDSDETKTLKGAIARLDGMTAVGDLGTIFTAQYRDHDTYEYDVLYQRVYRKTPKELHLCKEGRL